MAVRLKELRERRVNLVKQARELNDRISAENRAYTAEEDAQWKAFNADIDKLGDSIRRAERLDELENGQRDKRKNADEDLRKKGQLILGTKSRRNTRDSVYRMDPEKRERINALAIQGWCLSQLGLDTDERHEKAARLVGIRLNSKHFNGALDRDWRRVRSNAMSLTAAAGGYTIPQGFSNALEKAMLDFGPMLAVADILRTDAGNTIPWPTVNDTGNTGELLAENTSVGSSTDPTFSVRNFAAYKFSSKLVLISTELLADSAFDMAVTLGLLLGERLGRVLNTYFTTGTGTSQPQGITVGATTGKTTAAAAAITLDEILDLIYSVDPAYRPQGSFMAHDNIYLALRKLKDTTNQYLWQPSVQAGQPDRLMNYPALVNRDMASTIATTNRTMLFGMLSKYKVRQVAQIRMRRLVERYADTDQEGFVGFMRADGALLDAGVAPVKRLVQA